jgi:hypothetical protein
MLALVAEVYIPYLSANAQANAEGRSTVELQFADRDFVAKTSPYKTSCLRWLKAELARLGENARVRVRSALNNEAAWTSLQASAAELATVPPQAPR